MSEQWKVTKNKLTGESRAWHADLLAEDEYGTWLYAPAGTTNRDRAGRPVSRLAMDGVQLITRAAWWTAWWWQDGGITVDIATPAERAANSADYVDLELDLWSRGNDFGLVDQDEYDAARDAAMITDEQDHHARAAATVVCRMLAGHDEPFATLGTQWLRWAQATAR
ncbi:DUF402 domain-containing protein [Microlunatus soli]|uniref:DUF402 domain-containing protein n=1 Tax=Microlunatus soli TaxID=630515 RepID=UPI0012F9B6FF|nr:DUF402 domain-containing protein [Microlunatus soli]